MIADAAPPATPDHIQNLFVRDDDEGLFSRDINGQLVRVDAPTEGDYEKSVTLQIDGQTVTVPLAEPLKDANGSIVVDVDGRTTPRYTTIFDAAQKLFIKKPGDEHKIPIPILCHQPHMTPVAVCRMCVVQIYGQKRGARAAERKLLPACQHPVKDSMEVFTMRMPGADGDRVRAAVKIVTELLTSEHLKDAPAPAPAAELRPFNELGQMVDRIGAIPNRFQLDILSDPPPPAPPGIGRRKLDASSPVFIVDHSACILCERCIRACDEVKNNQVIGRTGKGTMAGVSFDLNDRMGDSSCVRCGECMVSCPTSAITFKPVAQVKLPTEGRDAAVMPATELIADSLFAGVPPKFFLWQQGLVVRRRVKKGEVLCEAGEPGNTAYVIKSGKLRVDVYPSAPPDKAGLMEIFRRKPKPILSVERSAEDLIVGEMACLSGLPRSADVVASEPGEILEIRRNVLDRLMRLPSLRDRFEAIYRARALDLTLQSSDLFRDMKPDEFSRVVEFLRPRLSFVRVNRGQVLFRQGDMATEVYLVRLGHVQIAISRFGNEPTLISRPPGTVVGEIGIMALSDSDSRRSAEEVDRAIEAALISANGNAADVIPAGRRSATCTALDNLELARISRPDYLALLKEFPTLRKRLVQQALGTLRNESSVSPLLQRYVEQGLYEGQALLVIDLDKCTRCDLCTQGCIDAHGDHSHGVPVTRMLRDGKRFENYLIGTACRSCKDPYCMAGCPVDSIHRGRHLQIVIEDHCIGCGLCAANCPYGNISIIPNLRRQIDTPDPDEPGRTVKVAQLKASTCDLCDALGERDEPMPRCVYSCPHDAAHRMSGEELLRAVMERSA